MNETADSVSKLVDYDDWFVSHEFFKTLDALWGPHSVDRFANDQNTKLLRLNSLFGRQTVKQWMRSRKTGLMKIIGLFHPSFLFQQ